MYLIMGITGRIGSGVANQLLSQGKQVRALVRNYEKAASWREQGVELVEGDWQDANVIEQALLGVEGAFFMLPPVYFPSPDFIESKVLISAFGKALRAISLPRLVVLSSNGAEKTEKLGAITPLSLLEQELQNLPYPTAFIRPGSFYENFIPALKNTKNGIFKVFYSDTTTRHPMTAIQDITQLAADLLTGLPWHGTRVIELGTLMSADELAVQLSNVLKTPVKAQSIPRAEWVKTLEGQMGFPKGQTWAFEAVYDGTNSHWIDFGVTGTEKIEGVTSAQAVFEAAYQAMQ